MLAAAVAVTLLPWLRASAAGPIITTIAGTGGGPEGGGDTGDGGQATLAVIGAPRSIFPTAGGGYIFAEPFSHKIRLVGPDGIVSTVAGTGTAGYNGDNIPATSAQINLPHSASPTPDGGFLIADTDNNRIRKVSSTGIITTVAGNGSQSYGGDGGPATAASINNPRGVFALPDGSFIFPDSGNNRVRKVSASGVITTIAGNGTQGYSGDGGLAVTAALSIPFGVAPTSDGSGVLIVDVGNQVIRQVSSTGIITTVAGNGTRGYGGDGGPATSAMLADPFNLIASPGGGFLIADASNERIRQVSASGIITTIAGDGVQSYGGDGGAPTQAGLSAPKAVDYDANGALMIADYANNRVRFVGTPVAPANVAPPAISGNPQTNQTLTATAGRWSGTGPTFAFQWLRCDTSGAGCSPLSGAVSSTYTPGTGDIGSTLRVTVTASNASGSAGSTSAQTPTITQGPYVLTVSETAGGDDGDVQSTAPTSGGYPPTAAPAANTTGTVMTAGRRNAYSSYFVYDALMRFNLSSLPSNATVVSATLQVYVTGSANGDGRNLVAEWVPASDWPITASDYALTSTANALSGVPVASIGAGSVDALALTGLSGITPGGTAGLRLAIDGGQPSGDNYVQMATFDNASSQPVPQLVVNYTATATPPTPPSNTAAPAISGSAQTGQVLTASNGTWSGTTPMTYGDQWQRCDVNGAGCAPIGGATAGTYTVASADAGSTIRVAVTATNGGGSASATSAQTATVAAAPSTLTVTETASGDDGDVQSTSPTSGGYPPTAAPAANTTGTVMTAGRRNAYSSYFVYDNLVRFNLSGLPSNATVTSATLRVYVTGTANGDGRNLVAEWVPASDWPITASDYALTSTASALSGVPVSSISTGAVNALSLTGLSGITPGGTAGLRLTIDGGQPAGDNYVQMATFDNTSSLPVPQLVVTYTTSST
ncbi:MAG TPA: DNRLRE domain-containing protein, partial [Candidatus Dormibacteraeota bacterium]|nr:DNRLRE domain-containing protein [Candidatus Dormibacteraeota bacterium]